MQLNISTDIFMKMVAIICSEFGFLIPQLEERMAIIIDAFEVDIRMDAWSFGIKFRYYHP